MAIYNADTLHTNNPDFTSGLSNGKGTGYPIVYANEIGGVRSVQSLEDLNKIPDNVLSRSGNNTDNDAIGQLWYVIDEDKYYKLKDWEDRTWEDSNDEITSSISEVKAEVKEVSDKVDAIEVPTKVSELTNDSKYQTEAQVNATIQQIVGAAPEALDTLEEIADKLSDNDNVVAGIVNTLSTKADATALSEYYKKTEVDSKIADAVTGGVESIDFTVYETKEGAANKYQPKGNYLTQHQDISGKADKSEIPSLEGYATESWVENQNYLTEHQDISGKVDKVAGKGLSTNDFTNALKEKLEGLQNYDDTELSDKVEQLITDFDTLIKDNPNKAINSFNEIVAFLNGIEDSETLEGIIGGISSQISNLDNAIKAEKERAEGVEEELDNKITTVTTGLSSVSQTLNTKIAEIEQKDSELDTKINTVNDTLSNEIDTFNSEYTEWKNEVESNLESKAYTSDLSNVLADVMIDEPLLDEINTITRDQLKKDLFIDLWNERCFFGKNVVTGKYDPDNAPDEDHPFFLNELWFSYEEALRIFLSSHPKYVSIPLSYSHSYPGVKTLIPSRTFGNDNHSNTFMYCSALINVRFVNGYLVNLNDAVQGTFGFYACRNLERVLNPLIPLANITEQNLLGCVKLHQFKLKLSSANCNRIDIRYSELWSLESISYTVNNKTAQQTVTIVVHSNVYAKIIGDETNDVYNSLTNEEKEQWTSLLQIAIDKNISFATV